MRLHDLLKKIKTNDKFKSELLAASTGKQFEEKIREELISDGEYTPFNSDKFKKLECYTKIHEELLSYEHNPDGLHFFESLVEVSKTRMIVTQPFGSQQKPDLLLIHNGYCLGLEIKFTKKKLANPIYNSGFPVDKLIYLFGSYNMKDITFFNGSSVESFEHRSLAKKLFDKNKDLIKNEGEEFLENIYIYYRPMYIQKGNSWNDPNRGKKEDDSIERAMFF